MSRSYMPKQMLATTEVYAKPLDNPGVSTAAMFDNFVRKIVGVSQDKYYYLHILKQIV